MSERILMKRSLLFTIVLLFATIGVANAAVTLSPLFSDHMVLQRDKPVPVYGMGSPGESVTVTFNGQTPSTTANSGGEWRLDLTPMSANIRNKARY